MTDAEPVATRVDLAFPMRGSSLPRDYREPLAAALGERLPWLGREPGTGMHRLNAVAGGGPSMLLSGRTRLILRVPRERADEAAGALGGCGLNVAEGRVDLGVPSLRELLPWGTLYAHFVASEADELGFLAAVEAELQALGATARAIVGRAQALGTGGAALPGYSLMLDHLSPEASLRVLDAGLGAHRRLGCGLFVPHKSAAAVGA